MNPRLDSTRCKLPTKSATKSATKPATAIVLSLGLLVIALSVGASACFVGQGPFGQERTAFTASSLDLHDGKPQTMRLAKLSAAQAARRMIVLAGRRDLVLVEQSPRCDATRCDLAFRSKPLDKRVFRASGALHKTYYSRYFISLRRDDKDATQVSAIGVPVLDGDMACPLALAQTRRCKAVRLDHPKSLSLAAHIKKSWGYTVDASNESETLDGLLAELARDPATSSSDAVARAARTQAPIVAVFDIDDQAKVLAGTTRRQLSEYLATAVTQKAAYRVVPRQQLRARLAKQKRASYRLCVDRHCQIELGKALAAQKVLTTKLLRVGKRCILTAQLYDLRTEAAERAASAKSSCDGEKLLIAIDALAMQLH